MNNRETRNLLEKTNKKIVQEIYKNPLRSKDYKEALRFASNTIWREMLKLDKLKL